MLDGARRGVWHNCHVNEQADPERRAVLELLKRHGDEATSFQMLEPGHHYWIEPDACVAYADVGSAWVTVGEPVCANDAIAQVVERFCSAAERAGKRVRFFHVGEAFVQASKLAANHIGEQPLWDPQKWERTLKDTRSLREQLRRARAKGVTVRLVDPHEMARPDAPLRKACDALIQRWLAGRGMHEMRFMVLVKPFDFAEERRYVVAEREGAIVGFAAAVPIYRRKGWFIEDLLRDPQAPNGTAELLVDALMRDFAAQGSSYATLGLAPLSGDVGKVLSATRDATAQLYNFEGVRSFKEKLRPYAWEPVYVAYRHGELGLFAMRDVLRAFASGGLLRFGMNTLLHQRTLATCLLAGGLVPWTVALLTIDTARWFPSELVQYAWAGFDVLLIALMFSLVRRWRTPVARLLSVLTLFDALLTMLQVLLWNVWTAKTGLAWTLVAIGCIGPALAAWFFWRTRRLALRSSLAVHRPPAPEVGERALSR